MKATVNFMTQKMIVEFADGNPCRTIADWINNYWNTPANSKRRKWGKVHRHNIYDYVGFTGYCNSQKAFKERRQEYTGEVELEMGKICKYEKR